METDMFRNQARRLVAGSSTRTCVIERARSRYALARTRSCPLQYHPYRAHSMPSVFACRHTPLAFFSDQEQPAHQYFQEAKDGAYCDSNWYEGNAGALGKRDNRPKFTAMAPVCLARISLSGWVTFHHSEGTAPCSWCHAVAHA